jgi:hypothetical protein
LTKLNAIGDCWEGFGSAVFIREVFCTFCSHSSALSNFKSSRRLFIIQNTTTTTFPVSRRFRLGSYFFHESSTREMSCKNEPKGKFCMHPSHVFFFFPFIDLLWNVFHFLRDFRTNILIYLIRFNYNWKNSHENNLIWLNFIFIQFRNIKNEFVYSFFFKFSP